MNIDLTGKIKACIASVNDQLEPRAAAAGQAMKDAVVEVMRGQRHGKVYKKPGGGSYTASAPGEVPAVRTGNLRNNWRAAINGDNPVIETHVPYAGYMENGTPGGMIQPRPFVQKVIDEAKPRVLEIYGQPFNLP